MSLATRKSLEPCDIAWAAGLFEGEGCISLYSQPRKVVEDYKKLYLSMKMTDKDIMERFAEIVGGSVRKHHTPSMKKGNHKVQWIWTVFNEEAERVAMLLLPFLGERRTSKFWEVFEEVHS